jgi:hypothetical protein
MFGGNTKLSAVAHMGHDPAADDDIPVWIAPLACEIVAAKVTVTNAVNGSTANYFDLALYNGGTAGTALTAIAGTIGGTAGWSALVPVSFTVSNGTVAAGELVKVRYNEEGTGTFGSMAVQLDYVVGHA